MTKKIKTKFNILIVLIIFTIYFAVIPVHGITNNVIIGGEAFGVKLYCEGVMVTKFESFYSGNEPRCPAKECGLKENDIIINVNNQKIQTNEKLSNIIEQSNGEKIKLKILRENNPKTIHAQPIKNNDGLYCLGVWVRDSCAGIGTITYYNPQENSYGALGHGICDVDSGGLMISDNVEILKAEINGVTKSSSNNIGTLNGLFSNEILANVGYNTPIGIYGKINKIPENPIFQVSKKEKVKLGRGYIYSTVDGTKPQKYSIEIIQICNYDTDTNKNFIFKITDNELLQKTGGIVQGMSGSPIIQDGKIVGAITHVLINKPEQGYGVYIENMLEASQ